MKSRGRHPNAPITEFMSLNDGNIAAIVMAMATDNDPITAFNKEATEFYKLLHIPFALLINFILLNFSNVVIPDQSKYRLWLHVGKKAIGVGIKDRLPNRGYYSHHCHQRKDDSNRCVSPEN